MREVQHERGVDHEPDHGSDDERRADAAAVDVQRDEHEDERHVHEEQEPEQHAPADRAEDPFAEEHEAPDEEQETRDEEDADGRADQRHHPLDLVHDVGELRLGELHVSAKEAFARGERCPELAAQARRCARIGRARRGIRSSAHRRRVVCHGTSGGVGRPRWYQWQLALPIQRASLASRAHGVQLPLGTAGRVAAARRRYARRRWNRSARPSCSRSARS
jgi:hypothetical protein